MKKVKIISVEENKTPKFVKTNLIKAEREGEEITWESVKGHDSVHVIVDNTTTKEILLVKQVRIPVLVNDARNDGIVFEACAGLVDKDKSLLQIVQEEIVEELGYNAKIANIAFIKTLKSSVGKIGSNSSMYFATVTEDEKVSDGGGIHGEDIEVVRIPYDEVEAWMFEEKSGIDTDAATMFLMMYWVVLNRTRSNIRH